MDQETDLSPEAAEDLGHIAADLQAYICLACGHLNSLSTETCAACGTTMQVPWGEITDSYLSAVDLLRNEQVSSDQLADLMACLRRVQSFYTAGTRYSVFG